jgi:uncharacterized protein YndB with AHSA1/START domain
MGKPPAMRVKEAIEIRCPAERIWELVSDPSHDPRWCPKVESVDAVGPSRWKVVHKPVPLRPPLELTLEHLELDPAARLRLREEDDVSIFIVEYRLEPTSTGTRFTQTSDFTWKTLPRVLHRMFARGVRRDVRAQLRALKRALEEP